MSAFDVVDNVSWIKLEMYPQQALFRTAIATQYVFASGARFVVPAGFVFDGASIPALGYAIVQSAASQARAVAFGMGHDYAYRTDATWQDARGTHAFSRAKADRVAGSVAAWCGITPLDAEEIRLALRVGAGASYRKLRVMATREEWLAVNR